MSNPVNLERPETTARGRSRWKKILQVRFGGGGGGGRRLCSPGVSGVNVASGGASADAPVALDSEGRLPGADVILDAGADICRMEAIGGIEEATCFLRSHRRRV